MLDRVLGVVPDPYLGAKFVSFPRLAVDRLTNRRPRGLVTRDGERLDAGLDILILGAQRSDLGAVFVGEFVDACEFCEFGSDIACAKLEFDFRGHW